MAALPITIEALRAGAGLPPEETTDALASYRVEHPCRLPGQLHAKSGNLSRVLWLATL